MGLRAPIALGLGSAVGVLAGKRASGPTLVSWPEKIRDAFPLAVGGAIGAKSAATLALLMYGRRARVSPALAATLFVGAGAGAIGAGEGIYNLAQLPGQMRDTLQNINQLTANAQQTMQPFQNLSQF